MAKLVGARAYNSGNISCANSTWTSMTMDSERFDTDTIHNTSTNTERLTCNTAGIYAIFGNVDFALNTTGIRGVRILLNGATIIANEVRDAASIATAGYCTMTISTVYQLSGTDYVELQALQVSGGALNVLASANFSPEFGMHRVG